MNASLKTTNRTEIQREEVEKQGSFGLGGERDHFALLLLGGLLINVLQVGGLAAEARAIVDDLAIYLAGCEVDETQGFPSEGGHAHLESPTRQTGRAGPPWRRILWL